MKDLATEIGTGENTDHQDFEDFLKDYFIENVPEEVGGKDTFEDNFFGWLHDLDTEEWFQLGDKFSRLNK